MRIAKIEWGVFGRGPKNLRKKGLLGLAAPGAPKSLEKIRKVSKKSRKCPLETFSRLFGRLLQLVGLYSHGPERHLNAARQKLPRDSGKGLGIRGVPKSGFSGSQKGGIKGEVKRREVVGERTGPEGERGGGGMREKGWEERGPKHTPKTLISVPL